MEERKDKIRTKKKTKTRSGAESETTGGKSSEIKENSMLSNYWYLYRGWFQDSRRNALYVAMILTGGILSQYAGLYIPKIAVSLVMEKASAGRLLRTLAAAGLLYFLTMELASAGYMLINAPCHRYRRVLQVKILDRICHTSYSNLEDPDYKMRLERAKELYEHWNRDVFQCIGGSVRYLSLLITIPITAGLLVTLHPVLIVILAAEAGLQYRLGQRKLVWQKKHRDFWLPLERKISYISETMSDFSCAKELRLYGADRWLLSKYGRLFRERGKWKRKQVRNETAVSGLQQAAEMAGQIAVYVFLITGVFEGRIGADDFVLYLGLSLSLTASLNEIAWQTGQMKESMLSIVDYRQMMNLTDREGTALPKQEGSREGKAPDSEAPVFPEGPPEIAFSHVSFAYPGTEEKTLKDIDFIISPGEKVALVGLNGAGKTTLIKLLCGMYEPSEGEILLNGRPASVWERKKWYELFSVVFQDIGAVPATIAENVAACPGEELDREQVKECLEQAGLWELVESLPHGMDTFLEKELFREGVDLSGGETQKLLLARAIYRKVPILILDEPMAALDAVAENRLYQKYDELTADRTSLFISHRLASTRFCDRILMMENGRITEEGSHDELLEKQGTYCRLFQVQSHYYQEDRTEDFSTDMNPLWEVSGYVSE